MQETVGLLEVVGLAGALVGADAALKAANVRLVGYEMPRGSGWITVKLIGSVSAVQSAIDAGIAAVETKGGVVHSRLVIPRPARALAPLIYSPDTVPTPQQDPPTPDDGAPAQTDNSRSEGEPEPVGEDVEEVLEARPLVTTLLKVAEEKIGEPVLKDDHQTDDIHQEPEVVDSEPEAVEPVGPEQEDPPQPEEVCNLCGDPLCPRHKGEPRSDCIHFDNL